MHITTIDMMGTTCRKKGQLSKVIVVSGAKLGSDICRDMFE